MELEQKDNSKICSAEIGNKKTFDVKKGKILRVKIGYNPNSSSIGSIVFALPAALMGITASLGVVSGLIMSAFMKKSKSEPKQTVTEKKE